MSVAKQLRELAEHVDKLEDAFQRGGWRDDESREVALLREFIADVRLGIRDLDEYEEVCVRAGLWVA
jgi:hypothetical protein